MTNQESMNHAIDVLRDSQDYKMGRAMTVEAVEFLEEALAKQEQSCPECVFGVCHCKQEQGELLPDFYITERTADSIYKLKSRDWALCISGNKGPTMHKNIPVFVGYVKTKPVEQEQGEPVAKVRHDLDGHIGWNPSLTELPDEGTKLYTTPQQPKQEQGEPVARYIGEDWSGSLVSLYDDIPLNTLLYTTPQQRNPLTDETRNWIVATCPTPRHIIDAVERMHGIKE